MDVFHIQHGLQQRDHILGLGGGQIKRSDNDILILFLFLLRARADDKKREGPAFCAKRLLLFNTSAQRFLSNGLSSKRW